MLGQSTGGAGSSDAALGAGSPSGPAASDAVTRNRARQLNYPPSVLIGKPPTAAAAAAAAADDDDMAAAWPHALSTSPLAGLLPPNIELTTWQALPEAGAAILRLTHIYPVGEHPTLSKPVTVDICAVFGAAICAKMLSKGRSGAAFVEMTAAGDAPLETVERLVWKVKGETPPAQWTPPPVVPLPGKEMLVTIEPADTRTFRIEV